MYKRQPVHNYDGDNLIKVSIDTLKNAGISLTALEDTMKSIKAQCTCTLEINANKKDLYNVCLRPPCLQRDRSIIDCQRERLLDEDHFTY